ncbi:hypothetical protein KIH32_20005 [Pseudomonas fluorescens]|uniref:hypothetical protein n=1 Tax=Pseudomonas fluorescens TaxID=294 RepID=UPI001BDA1300|nr:hypothetical protein [Pseudomonas fluorescens]MBT0626195.1 hypothetical protein [Pseudomonas fluorescens]
MYELTLDDFRHFGAWFFPMDESVEDELTVRPLADKEVCSDYPIIVSTIFFNDFFEKYAARAGSSG